MFARTLLVAVLIVANLVTPSTATSAWALPIKYMLRDPDLQRAVVEGYVRYYFDSDADIMIAIANCESTGMIHTNNKGELRRNPHTGAAGVFQVLLGRHAASAKKQGLDIVNDLQDYIRFVHFLYENDKRKGGNGLRPWRSSSRCWSGPVAKIIADRADRRNRHSDLTEVAEAKK